MESNSSKIRVHIEHYIINQLQIDKFMPLLSSGEMVGAIAMTEPDAGSDLQGIRTKAKRDEENGDFILNGSKVGNANFI